MPAEHVNLNDQVRAYWEQEACGTDPLVVRDAPPMSLEWFDRVEQYRYQKEPFIHSVAQFTRWHDRDVLEVGVGAGTDHLQFARAGARLAGVDLTDTAIATTRHRLDLYGLSSDLRRVDAERLPFPDTSFDLVYSWGVIHHSENPGLIVREIRRVLRPGGEFAGMFYGRRSLLVLRRWVKHALLAGRPFRSFADVVWHHMESIGTKAYTERELSQLFASFSRCETTPVLTPYDVAGLSDSLARLIPQRFGWNIAVRAVA